MKLTRLRALATRRERQRVLHSMDKWDLRLQYSNSVNDFEIKKLKITQAKNDTDSLLYMIKNTLLK